MVSCYRQYCVPDYISLLNNSFFSAADHLRRLWTAVITSILSFVRVIFQVLFLSHKY